LFAWRKLEHCKIATAFLAIALCLISILVANSRGAVLFAILILLLAGFVYFFKINRKQRHLAPEHRMKKWVPVLGLIVAVFLVFFVAQDSISTDRRWHSMADKVKIGLTQANPLQLLCDGLSPEAEMKIRDDYKHREPAYVQELIDGLKTQDGGRILLMRAGLELVLENPRGLDGSRKTYEKLIEKKCGHVPQLRFEHTHQSWLDISLALGWLGAGIFAWVLIFFMKTGWRGIDSKSLTPWAFALFLICGFWIMRGFVDSLYREHYLQMQAILISYLFGRLISEEGVKEDVPFDI
jgi:O-antigen ligase